MTYANRTTPVRRTLAIAVLLLATLISSSISHGNGANVSPGYGGDTVIAASPEEIAYSPDKRYEIHATYVAKALPGEQCNLLLRDTKTGANRQIDTWQRSVEVLWAPDSKHFAVTYNIGSNISFVRIYPTEGRMNGLDPYDTIEQRLGPLPEVEGDTHKYFNAKKWQDSSRLLLSFTGHWDDRRGAFAYEFEVSLAGNAKLLYRKIKR